ncbi:MAG: hypothetical protein ACSW8D_07640, partial [Prevotella sp.]
VSCSSFSRFQCFLGVQACTEWFVFPVLLAKLDRQDCLAGLEVSYQFLELLATVFHVLEQI